MARKRTRSKQVVVLYLIWPRKINVYARFSSGDMHYTALNKVVIFIKNLEVSATYWYMKDEVVNFIDTTLTG